MNYKASIGAVCTARAYLSLAASTSNEALVTALLMPAVEFHDAVLEFGKKWLSSKESEARLYAEMERRQALRDKAAGMKS